jgi:F-type H+-transporting ATPase subunit b
MSQLLSTFGINWMLLLAQMVNFAILLFVLKRYAYGPILSMLHKRREIIRQGMEDASRAKQDLTQAEHNAAELLKEAKINAHALVSDAQNQANQYIATAKNEGDAEKNLIVQSAQGEIEALRHKNEIAVKEKAVEHIMAGIRSMLGDEVDERMNDRLIKRLTKVS